MHYGLGNGMSLSEKKTSRNDATAQRRATLRCAVAPLRRCAVASLRRCVVASLRETIHTVWVLRCQNFQEFSPN
jgi:hypothetical protein